MSAARDFQTQAPEPAAPAPGVAGAAAGRLRGRADDELLAVARDTVTAGVHAVAEALAVLFAGLPRHAIVRRREVSPTAGMPAPEPVMDAPAGPATI
jgi:hypothetical protein